MFGESGWIKTWRMNRLSDRFLIVTTNLDGFSRVESGSHLSIHLTH